MRHVIFLDNKIQDAEFEQWRIEDSGFWFSYIGIKPDYRIIRTDFTEYPTEPDKDGDMRPTRKYLQALTDQVESQYGAFGCDFIMMMVHHTNWQSGRIWGTNFSYVFGSQCLEYCRWDQRLANTFGTAYHERHHSFDAVIEQELGVVIEPILGVDPRRYDYCITHGNCGDWKYIRYKENIESLKIMKPYLQQAFLKRAKIRLDKLTLIQKLIKQIADSIYRLRMLSNQKNGVPRT